MSFSYCLPNLSELKNLIALGPRDSCHVNSGELYFPYPPKSTKPFSGYGGAASVIPSSSFSVHVPCTLLHPLLKPGSTRLISSPKSSPFSVSQSLPVIGSKSIPKLFLNPYE